MITRQGWDGAYVLKTKDGKHVNIGQRVTSFRGETMTLTEGYPPHKPDSEGKVIASGRQFYAGVFGLKWVRTGEST